MLSSILSTSLFAALLTGDVICATPLQDNDQTTAYAVREQHPVPRGWTVVGEAPKDRMLQMHIGLSEEKPGQLESELLEVSDPTHPRYGQHLSSSEVDQLVKPSAHALDQVHDWLASHNVSTELDYSPTKDWIKFRMPVGAAEALLNTTYSIFRHEDGTHLVRTPQWSLPRHLHDHISLIQPTNSFFRAIRNSKPYVPLEGWQDPNSDKYIRPYVPPRWRPGTPVPDVSKICNASAVLPDCIRTLYGTIDYKPQAAGKNKVGIANYLGETSNRSDIRLFLERYRADGVSAAESFRIERIEGGEDRQTPNTPEQNEVGLNVEGNLDAETILGIAHPTPLTAFNTGGEPPPFQPDDDTPENDNEPFLAWVQYVSRLPDGDIPQVISTSYGDSEQTVPESYAKRVCSEFARLGARGITLFFPSGDSGVGPKDRCFTNDASRRPQFLPQFPASCPYVTAVGGTKDFAPEVVAYNEEFGYSPGSGFSRYFPRPSYQEAAVRGYLAQQGNEFKGLYNDKGRAYPDISAQSQAFVIVWNGSELLLDGTSASTPAAAGVFGLVNDALIARGRRPLGFLNPLIYRNRGRGFEDVVSGESKGCGGGGFKAKKGWDVASGWGTPKFEDLRTSVGV